MTHVENVKAIKAAIKMNPRITELEKEIEELREKGLSLTGLRIRTEFENIDNDISYRQGCIDELKRRDKEILDAINNMQNQIQNVINKLGDGFEKSMISREIVILEDLKMILNLSPEGEK